MNYKGFEAKIEYDDEARIFHGEVINLRDVITFQGECVDELEQAFRDSVEDYLDFCAKRGEKPEKPFSGKLILRLSPELYREVTYCARRKNISVNSAIAEAVATYTSKQ